MKQDHSQFSASAAYRMQDLVASRVQRFVPMVRKAAWHIHGAGHEGLDVDDLMQAGFIALTECARNHEGPGEDGFAAYAKIRVRGAMFDLLRKHAPESRTTIKRKRLVDEAIRSHYQHHGRNPTPAELADALGVPVGELDSYMVENIQLVSMETSYDEQSSAFAADLPDAFSLLCEMEDNERLGTAMELLPDRLKLILQLFFVEELNLTEISQVLEVSVPRVHQLKAQALLKLREIMEREAA